MRLFRASRSLSNLLSVILEPWRALQRPLTGKLMELHLMQPKNLAKWAIKWKRPVVEKQIDHFEKNKQSNASFH